MAIFPCDFAPHRYPQPQQSVYTTYAMDGLTQTTQLRLCPTHFSQMRTHVQERLALIDEDSTVDSKCTRCDHDANVVVSTKVFAAKADMEQYYGDFCGPCAEEVLKHIKFAQGRPLSSR